MIFVIRCFLSIKIRRFGSGSDAELREAARESEKIGKAMLAIENLSAEVR
jgi:hypothetical protein